MSAKILVADLAAASNAQVWLESSRTDGPVSVLIEDGHVAGQEVEQTDDRAVEEFAKLPEPQPEIPF